MRRAYICSEICVGLYTKWRWGVEDIVKSTEGQGDVDQAGPGGNTAQLLYRGGDVALILSALLPTGGVFLTKADSCLFMSTIESFFFKKKIYIC